MGKQWKQWQTSFLEGSKTTADGDCSHEIKRCLLLGIKVMTNLDSIQKSRYITNKCLSPQGCGFSSSHVWMWELDYKESRALKNRCFWTVWLEKTLESPLDSKEIKPFNLKGNQSWIFTGRTSQGFQEHLGAPFRIKELMLLNCGVGEDSWVSRGLQRHLTSPS